MEYNLSDLISKVNKVWPNTYVTIKILFSPKSFMVNANLAQFGNAVLVRQLQC